MKTADPYLNFNGITEQAFNFYKSVFGGEFSDLQRFRDFPDAGKVPPESLDMIMHISLPLGPNNMLHGTDAPESMGFKLIDGNNFSVMVNTGSEEEAARLFKGLSAGGKITMELMKTFWGAYYGACEDKFGIQWMVNFNYSQA
jgi:PhnB protein